jgi:hypothetical protein
MRVKNRIAALALTAGAVLAGSLTAAGPAAAETPAGVCGAGYYQIDSHELPGLSTIYLLYNGNTDCVVNRKTAYVGQASFVSAFVWLASTGWTPGQVDQGQYKYYAGPKYVNAPRQCIVWGGAAGPGTGSTEQWGSAPSHCG